MKYCFNCGAPLVGSAASFCSECGKAMPLQKEVPHEPIQGSTPVVAKNEHSTSPQTQTEVMPQPEDINGAVSLQPSDDSAEAPTPDEFGAQTSIPEDENGFASESGEQTDVKDEFSEDTTEESDAEQQPDTSINPQDDGYDGYYNDIMPEDEGYIKERLEPELIKRIAFVIAGVIVVVLLSVLIMNLL